MLQFVVVVVVVVGIVRLRIFDYDSDNDNDRKPSPNICTAALGTRPSDLPLNMHPPHNATQCRELFLDIVVATVDVIDPVDQRIALGDKPGQYQAGGCA